MFEHICEAVRSGSVHVPYLSQYFGLWAMEPAVFAAASRRVEGLDVRVHMENMKPRAQLPGGHIDIGGGIAMVAISGVMMKHESSAMESTSTVEARRQIRSAAAEPGIRAILLLMDTPGGTVAGTESLAADISRAAEQKPVIAHAEDLVASAGYWVAAQASEMYAGPSALVGSIGTYGVLIDSSEAAAKDGYIVHVVRAGKHKGAGTPGTEITDEQLSAAQATVDAINKEFLAGVARGRKMTATDIEGVADGRAWIAKSAANRGLIDGVQSLDLTMDRIRELIQINSEGGFKMTSENDPVVPEAVSSEASVEELRTLLPHAPAAFLVEQLDQKATREQALRAYIDDQTARLTAAKNEVLDLQATVDQRRPGVEPVGAGKPAEPANDPAVEWESELRERIAKNGGNRGRAVLALVTARPDLHAAYLEHANSK